MNKKFSTQKLIIAAMLAAIAGVLMDFEFNIPMMPPFYKVDFSDVPSVIAIFLLGPWWGAAVEVVKIVIKLITTGTNSMYVGELANLLGIVLFVFPIWIIYKKGGKTIKAAIIALIVSLPIRIAFSCFCNACITLPLYANAYGMTLDEVVVAVSSVNPNITNLTTFIVLATIPFNLLKNSLNYIVGYFLFNRLKKIGFIRNIESM